jgi:hypothetical protein
LVNKIIGLHLKEKYVILNKNALNTYQKEIHMAWTDGAQYEREAVADGRTGAVVNGSFIANNPGAPLVDTALQLAADAGYGKFRVFLNNEEVEPEDAPDVISEGDVIKITAYDVAG